MTTASHRPDSCAAFAAGFRHRRAVSVFFSALSWKIVLRGRLLPELTSPLGTPVVRRATVHSAFTILEVLVASAILAILVAILLGTLSASLALWRNTDNKVTADREGRSAQLILGGDLANAVMPANPALWPRLVTNGGTVFLQFLTLKPQDYQGDEGNVGDVCYVEYAVDQSARRLVRKFQGSGETFSGILKVGSFDNSPAIGTEHKLVADNLLVDNRAAARRMELYGNVKTNHFVILNTNLQPLTGAYSAANRPAMVEFNFAAVDPQTATNTNMLANTNILLRSAGLFTSRVKLPDPAP